MVKYIAAIGLTGILFVGMILLLAAKPKFSGKLTGTFILAAIIGGLFFYGYGFAYSIESFPLAVIRSVLAVCGMFVAKMDYASVKAAPGLGTVFAEFVFWLVHLMALYATASAAITTVGAEALRKLRMMLLRKGEMNLIYGITDDSLAFAKELAARKNSTVVMVDSNPAANHVAAAAKAGIVLRTDKSAVDAANHFLKSIHVGGEERKVHVYVLTGDISDGLRFATAARDSLKARGVKPGQTTLVLHGREDAAAMDLQVLGEHYGYGNVTVFQETGLAARLLMRTFPPCDSIRFDGDGRAAEDFEALVIGFGQVGQMVLKQLIMNGQFEGSTFRAAVFSPDCDTTKGFFAGNQELQRNYEITFHPYDGRSTQLFEHLRQRKNKIKYVVVCTGAEKVSNEIAEEVLNQFEQMNVQTPVYLCSRQGVKRYGVETGASRFQRLYQADTIADGALDKMAMLLNQQYCKDNGASAVENWMACDYFSRMSSRASADFLASMLRSAGKTEEEVLAGGWALSETMLENLSKTEHKRWCAFHYTMGFSCMEDGEFASRAQEYLRQLAQNGKATIRISKNMENRTHACLVEWDELDLLSEKEAGITGRYVNYKQMDTNNVLAVPDLLQGKKEAEVAYGKK